MHDEGAPPPLGTRVMAAKLAGSTVIVGMNYLRPDGSDQEQMFGAIEIADAEPGVVIVLERSRSGELYWLAPDLRAAARR